MHVNTAGIEEQLILRKRKPAIFQKDFLVPSECYLLLYLDCTDYKYKATSYSGQWSANVSSIQQPPTKSCTNAVQMTWESIFTPSRNGIKATIPSFSKSSSQRKQSLYDGSFAVMGPRLWNSIPSDLYLIEDPLLFKAKLSSFLKPFPDNPSVSNYSCPSGNS